MTLILHQHLQQLSLQQRFNDTPPTNSRLKVKSGVYIIHFQNYEFLIIGEKL